MIDYYDAAGALSPDEVETIARQLYIDSNYDAGPVIDWLAELASEVWSCPDKCDEWAVAEFERLGIELEDEAAESLFDEFRDDLFDRK